MPLKISWHADAVETFLEIVVYFEEEGMIQAAENFRERVEEKIEFVSKFPEAGRPTATHKKPPLYSGR